MLLVKYLEMIVDLILWRHAEAEDSIPDNARILTAKGRKQAEKVAALLRVHLPEHARILVSPATRTQQTVAALTKHYTVVPALAVGASVESVLQAAGWPDAGGTVLLVGHQPTLGEVAASLLGCEPLSIKKGALWWFGERDGYAQLRLVIAPEFL